MFTRFSFITESVVIQVWSNNQINSRRVLLGDKCVNGDEWVSQLAQEEAVNIVSVGGTPVPDVTGASYYNQSQFLTSLMGANYMFI